MSSSLKGWQRRSNSQHFGGTSLRIKCWHNFSSQKTSLRRTRNIWVMMTGQRLRTRMNWTYSPSANLKGRFVLSRKKNKINRLSSALPRLPYPDIDIQDGGWSLTVQGTRNGSIIPSDSIRAPRTQYSNTVKCHTLMRHWAEFTSTRLPTHDSGKRTKDFTIMRKGIRTKRLWKQKNNAK